MTQEQLGIPRSGEAKTERYPPPTDMAAAVTSGPVLQTHGDLVDQLPPSLQTTLDKILHAIADTKKTLQLQIVTVETELGLLRTDHLNLAERVKSNEEAIVELKPADQALQLIVDALTNRVLVLENRAEDGEGKSRRNTVQIVGMPEKN